MATATDTVPDTVATLPTDGPDRIVDESSLRPPPAKTAAEEEDEERAAGVDPIAPAEPLGKGVKARMCRERERAPTGCKRYRVRVRNYSGYAFLYIVAAANATPADLKAVKDVYLRESGLGNYIQKWADDGNEKSDLKSPRFDILVLKD
jgi:hypothetical protein